MKQPTTEKKEKKGSAPAVGKKKDSTSSAAAAGKTKKTGPSSSKRHANIIKIQEINASTCQRLCLRGGIKRSAAKNIRETCNAVLNDFLHTVLHDTIQYTTIRGKKTITPMDLNAALEKYDRSVFGAL